ncbi:MAG: hypothetical protein GXP41_11355 [Chloroflexi bacterium]|nr:hypothetical protein [Chloroflexota bacterium]
MKQTNHRCAYQSVAKAGILLLLFLLAAGGAGCTLNRPVLENVRVKPEVISPNADGVDDVARIFYTLRHTSKVSIYLVDEQGHKHAFRQDRRRAAGDYEAWFSGVINDRVLPNGHYRLFIEARPLDRGAPVQIERSLTIENADNGVPTIENLSVYPPVFTPNRDGVDDRITVGYSLAEEAARVDAYLLASDGTRYPLPEDQIRKSTAAGRHEHVYHGGVDLGAEPPPDGDYTVVVEAVDAAGNRDVVRAKVTIKDGGVPRAWIVRSHVLWNTDTVTLGGTLTFTATVENIGHVAIRTLGPPPGTTYTTRETYTSKGYPTSDGAFRLGLDYEGNSIGREYPYRWQLGRDDELTVVDGEKYLQPGQSVTISGHLRLLDAPPRTKPYFWLGLLHEGVRKVEDKVDPQQINIDY